MVTANLMLPPPGEAVMESLHLTNNGMRGGGDVASTLLANDMNPNSLRTNASLRKDEWLYYDQAVVEVAQKRTMGVADLQSRGLTLNLPNGLATTVLEYEEMNDPMSAEVNMDGLSRSKNDRVDYTIKYLPLPLIHCDFFINSRVLAASRKTGSALDITQAQVATRRVVQKAETILFQGLSSYAYGGGTIYGYEDFPNRNTYTLTAAWSASSTTGAQIINDVLGMKQASINARHYGPWVLYVPTAYETVLDRDYDATTPGTTIRERILKLNGIEAVKVSDYHSANTVSLVQMDDSTVRLVNGLDITTVQWASQGNMVLHFKVMAIWIPQIRADNSNQCGLTVGTV